VSALGPLPTDVVARAREREIAIGGMVGNERHAVRHVEHGADFVVAQGFEAAGHHGDITTMVLVPEVVDAVDPVPVVAAGGIGTGRQIAAALALGAQAVWLGSVWLTTAESDVDPLVKRRLLAARSDDTVRSRSVSGKQMRLLRNPWTEAWEGPDAPTPLPAPLQGILARDAMVSIYENRVEPLMTSAVGQIVGQLRERPVAAVLLGLMDELAEALGSVGSQFESAAE
jgi:NAD(P)H-dependent flavin oxidoreductase YrpB (nitropropane dioxygenase family)